MTNNSGDGHWVTINGNHIFIEDSSGGKVLKGRVEKTEPPIPSGGGDTPPDDSHGRGGDGGSGGDHPYEKEDNSIWRTVGKVLVSAASIALKAMATGSQTGGGTYHPGNYSTSHTNIDSSQQYKPQITNLINQSRTMLAQEQKNLDKLSEEVDKMPSSSYRNSLHQQYMQKSAELSNAKTMINHMEFYNNQDMYKEVADTANKLSSQISSTYPQNNITKLQPLGGSSSSPQSSYHPDTASNPPINETSKSSLNASDALRVRAMTKAVTSDIHAKNLNRYAQLSAHYNNLGTHPDEHYYSEELQKELEQTLKRILTEKNAAILAEDIAKNVAPILVIWDWHEQTHKYGMIHGSTRALAGIIGSSVGEVVAAILTKNPYLVAGAGISIGELFQRIIDEIFKTRTIRNIMRNVHK